MTTRELIGRIVEVSNLLALLLALSAILTTELARHIERRVRETGDSLASGIRALAALAALVVLSIMTIVALAGWMCRALGTANDGGDIEPVLWLFLVIGALVLGVFVWQVLLVVKLARDLVEQRRI